MLSTDVLAWQFLPYDGRLRKPLPDGTRPRMVVGWNYHTSRTIEMQWRRLEAYPRPLDALMRGAGPIACRVKLSGTVYEYPRLRRLYATNFTLLHVVNAISLLDHFAVELAERTLLRERMAGRETLPIIWDTLVRKQERLAGTRSMLPYDEGQFRDAIIRTQWEAESLDAGLPRYKWQDQKLREWEQNLEGTIIREVAGAVYQHSIYPPSLKRMASIKEATRAGQLSCALWSEEEEAAAVAAGLCVQAEEVNAELEERLLSAIARETTPLA